MTGNNRNQLAIPALLLACTLVAATGFVTTADARDGGDGAAAPPSAVTKPPAAKPKRVTPTKKQATPATGTERKPLTKKRSTVRRTVRRPRETAPSGMPVTGESRYHNDQVIVRYQLAASQGAMDALVRRLGLRHIEGRTFRLAGVTMHRYEITGGQPVGEIITALEGDSTVVNAQPNYLYTLQQAAKGAAGLQYAHDRLAIGSAHESTRGDGVTIAIIDSGVETSHPGLKSAKLEYLDVSDGGAGNAIAHGTAIAGIVSASGDVAGIAPDAHVIVLAAFSANKSGTVTGNSWTIAKAAEAAFDNGARIINMSFAGPSDPLVAGSVKGLAKRDVLMFAASGNEGPQSAPQYPAGYDEVLATTATDSSDAVYTRATGGTHLAYSAPGVEILSLAPNGGYGLQTGTSMATAHMSGLAALLIARDPTMSAARVGEILQATAKDLGEPGRDAVFGFGIPDARMALKAISKP